MSGFESNWIGDSNGGDVVRNHYGERAVSEKFGGQVSTSGKTKEMSWTFSYDDLPSYGQGKMEVAIPANAIIKAAYIKVKTAFAGGTSYNFDLYEADGTVIDADGIDSGVLVAALSDNAWIVCDGALVGATIGSAAGQLTIAATGTFTAGEAEVFVEYIDG